MPFKCIEAKELYAKDAKLKKQDVEILQEWLKKQPHLPSLEESQILVVLHSCYYKVEAAKTTIDTYFTRRSLCPEIFIALSQDDLKATYTVANLSVLPKTSPEGYGMVFMNFIDPKPDRFNCVQLLNAAMMLDTLYIHQQGFDTGVVGLIDMKGVSLGHLGKLNLNAIKHTLYHIQDGMPVRIKALHILNAIPLVDKFMVLIKPFLHTEIYNLIKFHSPNSDTLEKFIPKDCLPEDYGGLLPPTKTLQEQNLKNLLDNYDFFAWHQSQTVDESKRIGKSKIVNDEFGVEGTFKKLELD